MTPYSRGGEAFSADPNYGNHACKSTIFLKKIASLIFERIVQTFFFRLAARLRTESLAERI